MLVLSSAPRSELETRLLVDFAARPPHVVAPVLLVHPLLKAAAEDAQNPTPG